MLSRSVAWTVAPTSSTLPGALICGANAGGIYDLVRQDDEKDGPKTLTGVALSLKVSAIGHGVHEIYLQAHRDCNAFGGSDAYDSPEIEYNSQTRLLHQVAQIIRELFPSLADKLRIHGQWLELMDAESNTWSLTDLGLLQESDTPHHPRLA